MGEASLGLEGRGSGGARREGRERKKTMKQTVKAARDDYDFIHDTSRRWQITEACAPTPPQQAVRGAEPAPYRTGQLTSTTKTFPIAPRRF
jgi:hypothetical protein